MIIEVKHPIFYKESFRNRKLSGMFDVEPEHRKCVIRADLPIEEKNWSIGLIFGASGTGKSSIGRNINGYKYIEKYTWSENDSILDDFPQENTLEMISNTLASVGFSSPPKWLLPYKQLSNGQKMRADVARMILSPDKKIIYDEFTSVVDRQVAKICSNAVQKSIRKTDKQIIFLSCHDDIIEWLQPDFIYNTNDSSFQWRLLRRRPEIKLSIYKCETKQQKQYIWSIFRGHHYMSAELNAAAEVFYCVYSNAIIAMYGVNPYIPVNNAKAKKGSRLVVLPDYQGIGVGTRLLDYVASYYKNMGYKFYSGTSHIGLIKYKQQSGKWRLIQKGISMTRHKIQKGISNPNRRTASFEYIG